MNTHVDPIAHPSKRGNDLFDLSGILTGASNKGSQLTISFLNSETGPDLITIFTPRGRFIVDHFQKFAYESYPFVNNWQWHRFQIDENWMVSHMTRKFVEDILIRDDCRLPTLQDCLPAHQFILNSLLPHFNKLLNVNQNFCPVT